MTRACLLDTCEQGTVLLGGTTCQHALRHHGSTSTCDLTLDLGPAPGQRP